MAAENKISAVITMYDRIAQKDLTAVFAFRKKHTKKPIDICDVKDRLFMFYEDNDAKSLVGTVVMASGSPSAHFANEKKGVTVIPYVYDICFNHKKKYALIDKILDYLKEHVMSTEPHHIDHRRINADLEENDELNAILVRNGFEEVRRWTHRLTTKKYISYTWYGERPAKKKEELLLPLAVPAAPVAILAPSAPPLAVPAAPVAILAPSPPPADDTSASITAT